MSPTQTQLRTFELTPNNNISFPIGTILAFRARGKLQPYFYGDFDIKTAVRDFCQIHFPDNLAGASVKVGVDDFFDVR